MNRRVTYSPHVLASAATRRRLVQLLVFGLALVANGRSLDAVKAGSFIAQEDLAPGRAFGWLVKLEQDGSNARCTGSLVHSEWVITAAHCVGTASGKAYIGDSATSITIDRTEVLGLLDVAMLHLIEPTPVPPVAIADPGLPPFDGTPATIAGWGVDDSGLAATTPSSGSVLATTFASASDGLLLELAPNPSVPCSGDSGGPVIIRDAAGIAHLIGVITQSDPGCQRGGLGIPRSVFADQAQNVISPDITAPIATSGSLRTGINIPVEVPFEFSDPGGSPMTFEDVVSLNTTHGAIHACAAEAPPTTCTFTPEFGFVGIASVVYTVSDGFNETTASWEIDVYDAPTVAIAPVTVDEPTSAPRIVALEAQLVGPVTGPVTVDVALDGGTATLANDYRATATRVVLTDKKRTATLRVLVLPDTESEFDETIRLRVSTSAAVLVNAPQPAVTIIGDLRPPNHAPIVLSGTLNTTENTPVNIPLVYSDPDGDDLELQNATFQGGTITGFGQDGQNPFAIFQPDPGFTGTATFTYDVTDGTDTTTGTWTIVVAQ